MLEFASEVSHKVHIEGIDIASRLFPRTYPPNITFSIHSVTSLPLSWHSTFAYVHQRLLMAALTTSMWKSAISEMFRVLRPGGWVELLENGTPPSVGPYSAKLEAMARALWYHKGLMYDHEHKLPSILSETGFTKIHVDRRVISLRQVDRNRAMADVMYGMKTPMLKAGGFGLVSSAEEYDDVVARASKEWRENDGVITMLTFIATKSCIT